MNYREEHVLKKLVETYIATGRPVGSLQLVERMKLEVSPATVRNIFRVLEEEGFVVQPHTSAGRVPTDEGYRYYIDNLVFKQPTERQRERLTDQFAQMCEQCAHPAKATAKTLASAAQLLAIGGWINSRHVYGAGIADFMAALTQEESEAAGQAAMLVDGADEYITEGFAGHGSDKVEVYVGEDNPVFPSRDLGMLVRSIDDGSGDTVVLVLVGPKRMAYKKNATILNSMASIIETTL